MTKLKAAAALAAVLTITVSIIWTPIELNKTAPGVVVDGTKKTDASPPNHPEHAIVAALIPKDAVTSLDPVERATAAGVILDSKIIPTGIPNHWQRTRLVSSHVQPRPVLVREKWEIDPAQKQADCLQREMFLADQLIVRSRQDTTELDLRLALNALGLTLHERLADDVFAVRVPRVDLDAVFQASALLTSQQLVITSEPDGVGFGGGTPNDPLFPNQWSLKNNISGGTADTDIPDLWDVLDSAPGVVIAVLDSGMNFNHPDLQDVAWSNPGEIPGDGIDNDANGKIDDVTGWDFVNGDNHPADDHGHGTNATGIMVATRNNNIGMAGIVSGARILTCKILNASNSGLTSDLIAATAYARQRGIKIMNLSLQNYPYSFALDSEFSTCYSSGVLLCIGAGNQGTNNDSTPNYPSSYPQGNIIAVGNHGYYDSRTPSSNYGFTSVDLFAPGDSILGPDLGAGYSSFTGSSQATPHVTAVCAAISAANPTLGAGSLKNAVLESVTKKNAFEDICVTDGRLNAINSLGRFLRVSPDRDNDGDGYGNLYEYFAGTHLNSATSIPRPAFAEKHFTYARVGMFRVPRAEVYIAIETSTDLVNWTPADRTQMFDYSDSEKLLWGFPITGAQRAFYRLSVHPVP